MRVFIFKVIFKYLEENNEIGEFPYEEHAFTLRTCLQCTHVSPSSIKHRSNARRSLNFIFYQTKYKTVASIRRNV